MAQTNKWRIVWEANPDSENVDYYAIYKGTNATFNTMDSIGRVSHPNTEYVDSLNLSKGQMYYYRVVAVDDTGAVSQPSDAASASIPNILINQFVLPIASDTSFNLNQSQFVSDPDFGINQLTWDVDDPTPGDLIQEFLQGASTIRFITPTDSTIQDVLTFTVTDADSFYDVKTVNISLSSSTQNHPPVFTSTPDESAIAGQTYLYLVTAYDQDGDSLTFSLTNNPPSFLNVLRNANTTDTSAYISGTPSSSLDTTYEVTIYVNDGRGGDTTQTYELRVTPSTIENVSKVKAYPTPFIVSKANVTGITFSNVPINATLILYNLIGEPVFTIKVDSEPYLWNLKNNAGLDVQSGLYYYYIKDGSKVIGSGKVVIIR